jgi:hypothetical protein
MLHRSAGIMAVPEAFNTQREHNLCALCAFALRFFAINAITEPLPEKA